MFNGIIFNTGKVKLIKSNVNSINISILTNLKFSNKELGSSVSCNGVCLTINKIKGKIISFYISKETIKRSNFKSVKKNQIINLEKSLFYGQRISGHFNQGHVDTVATIKKITILDKSWLLKFKIDDRKYTKYIVEKASISINGVSLTVSKTFKNFFEIILFHIH